jgi:probable rRNA maturation factor
MSDDESPVLFRHRSRRLRRTGLRRFFAELARQLTPGTSVTCLITTDRDLRALNRKFRGEDYATDVLSFSEDIAISLDSAAAQAAEYGHSLDAEVRILMLHGLLHLAGMDHENDNGRMAAAEARWRRKLGLPVSLTERARA